MSQSLKFCGYDIAFYSFKDESVQIIVVFSSTL